MPCSLLDNLFRHTVVKKSMQWPSNCDISLVSIYICLFTHTCVFAHSQVQKNTMAQFHIANWFVQTYRSRAEFLCMLISFQHGDYGKCIMQVCCEAFQTSYHLKACRAIVH